LAGRIYDQLAIQSLHDLLTAAYDGRLSQVPGFGPRRVRAIRETLTGRLHRSHVTLRPTKRQATNQPSVAELLDVDREYHEQIKAGQLRYLTPRRFNPTSAAWLPVLYTERDHIRYTALYSNTARAHELEMTHDWVVIYRDDPNGAGPWTVITAFYGKLRGRRVVRGREKECEAFYDQQIVST
jgi:DNA polymerase (family 10)